MYNLYMDSISIIDIYLQSKAIKHFFLSLPSCIFCVEVSFLFRGVFEILAFVFIQSSGVYS